MKTRDEIGARVRAVITEHLSTTYRASRGTPEVTDDKALNENAQGENLGLDSLDLIEVTMAIEEDFDVELDDEKVSGLITLGELIDLLAERLGITASAAA